MKNYILLAARETSSFLPTSNEMLEI